MNKTRLEAFTDAIIAIAATIMVLELHPPKDVTLPALLKQWPVFLAYLISFTLIYVVWYSHHNLFNKAKKISSKTFLLNGIWLFALTLVPFVTDWVGEEPTRSLPEFLYAAVLLFWSLAFHLMDHQIIKDNPGVAASTQFSSRLILYGSFILGMILAFIRPILSLWVIMIMDLLLGIAMFRSRTTY